MASIEKPNPKDFGSPRRNAHLHDGIKFIHKEGRADAQGSAET